MRIFATETNKNMPLFVQEMYFKKGGGSRLKLSLPGSSIYRPLSRIHKPSRFRLTSFIGFRKSGIFIKYQKYSLQFVFLLFQSQKTREKSTIYKYYSITCLAYLQGYIFIKMPSSPAPRLKAFIVPYSCTKVKQ